MLCSMIYKVKLYFLQCSFVASKKDQEVDMDKKQVSFRIDPATIKKMKFLAVEQDRSLTDLFLEAINDILKKYDKSKTKQ